MAVVKVYKCDLCGREQPVSDIRRLGVRVMPADRPEDADLVDVGACCYNRPVRIVVERAAEAREGVLNG